MSIGTSGLVASVFCCTFQKSLWRLILYIFFFFFFFFIIVYMYIAPGDKVLKPLVTSVICYKFQKKKKKISLKSDFIQFFFHDFIHVYSPGAVDDNPLGTKFWWQQALLVTSVISCKFKKNLFEVWFYFFFFLILYMYIASGQGQTAPRGQSFYFNRNVLSLHSFVASFKIMSMKSDFIHFFFFFFFFHDLIHVYSPGAGVDGSRGQNFDVNRKALQLYPFVASFKEISLKSDCIHFFFFFFFMI